MADCPGEGTRSCCPEQRGMCFGRPGGQCRSATANKALLGAACSRRGEPVPAGTGREIRRLLCPGGAGAGQGGRLAGLGMLPRAGVFPPTSLGVTLAASVARVL